MKTLKLFLSFIIGLVLFVQTAHAQWIQTNGPGGGNVKCLTTNGTDMFAGTYGIYSSGTGDLNNAGSIFHSTDNGQNWTVVNKGLIDPNKDIKPNINALIVCGTNLFAGTENSGIFISTDKGQNWDQIPDWKTGKYISAFAVSDTNLFALSSMNQVILSNDEGQNWTIFNGGLSYQFIPSAIAINDVNIYVASGAGYGVYFSSVNGTSWFQPINNGLTNKGILALAIKGTKLFAGTDGDGVFCSSDNGQNWTPVNNGLSDSIRTTLNIQSLVVSGSSIFAGTSTGGIYISTNDGQNWTSVNDGLTSTIINTLAVNGTNIFAGTTDGVSLSTNNGTNWSQINNGIINTTISAFSMKGTNLYAGTEESGVFISTNSGINWTPINDGLINVKINDLVLSGINIFAGATNFDGYFGGDTHGKGGIYCLKNNLSWEYVMPANWGGGVQVLAVIDTNIISWGGHFNISTDGGLNWNYLKTDATPFVSSFCVIGTNLFAGQDGGGIIVSSNNGTNWNEINNGIPEPQYFHVYALAAIGTNLFAGAFYNQGVFLSTNSGTNWNAVNNGLKNRNINTLVASGTILFAGTDGGGVFFSTDNGANWTEANAGLMNKYVKTLFVSDTYLFAGTIYGGVWKRSIAEIITDVENAHNNLPIRFTLNQNYPNPFNPTTTINYSIPKQSFVTIKIYDALGREVRTLINAEKSAGNYNIEFNASQLTSGIYFYRMKVGDFTETKKLILLK